METVIHRYKFTDRLTLGKFIAPDAFNVYSLEDVDRHLEDGGSKIPGSTAIPRGRYEIVIDWSNRFRCLSLHVLGVDFFEGVRIHAGIRPEDTDGCVLVGLDVANDSLRQSVDALRVVSLAILNALLHGERVFVTVE